MLLVSDLPSFFQPRPIQIACHSIAYFTVSSTQARACIRIHPGPFHSLTMLYPPFIPPQSCQSHTASQHNRTASRSLWSAAFLPRANTASSGSIPRIHTRTRPPRPHKGQSCRLSADHHLQEARLKGDALILLRIGPVPISLR